MRKAQTKSCHTLFCQHHNDIHFTIKRPRRLKKYESNSLQKANITFFSFQFSIYRVVDHSVGQLLLDNGPVVAALLNNRSTGLLYAALDAVA